MADSAYFNVMNGKVSIFFSQNRKACFTKHNETASDVCGSGGLVDKSCPTLVTLWTVAHQAPLSMELSRKNTWVGSHFLPQRIFPPQDQNFVSCVYSIAGRFFFCFVLSLSHQGSPLMYICSQHILRGGFPHNSVKNPPAMHETPVRFLGWEDLLQKG